MGIEKAQSLSWFQEPDLNLTEEKYIKLIETIFQVQYASGKWDFIKCTPHQKDFHRYDIALKQDQAQSNLVEKSRNTSFTISSIIRLCLGNYYFRDEIVPLVRINDQKVKELIREAKKIIKHMRPVILKNGDYFPFNPENVNLKNVGMIEFLDRGVIWQGYPASASAAENIRGLRITRGLFDEINFCARFNDVYTAMRDASRGATEEGKRYFQLTLGTTWKGETPAKQWANKIRKLSLKSWRIFSWPVFDPTKFDKEKSPKEQNLTPITHWHNIESLTENWLENLNTFLEEFMCISVPADDILYQIEKVMGCINTELINSMNFNPESIYKIGCDPAGKGGDIFSISVFEEVDRKNKQKYLFYKKGVELEDMVKFCINLIEKTNPIKFVIDGNGIGYQLSESLKKRYPKIVHIIRGKKNIKIDNRQTIPFKEFLHTNQIKMFNMGEIELLNDDEQIYHYTQWKQNYECDRTERGHGDIVIANGLALMDSFTHANPVSQIHTNFDSKKNLERYANIPIEEAEW